MGVGVERGVVFGKGDLSIGAGGGEGNEGVTGKDFSGLEVGRLFANIILGGEGGGGVGGRGKMTEGWLTNRLGWGFCSIASLRLGNGESLPLIPLRMLGALMLEESLPFLMLLVTLRFATTSLSTSSLTPLLRKPVPESFEARCRRV